jgi:hypothetical protein
MLDLRNCARFVQRRFVRVAVNTVTPASFAAEARGMLIAVRDPLGARFHPSGGILCG